MIDKYPQDGISKHLHLLTVRRGLLTENSMSYKFHLPDGTIIDERMPTVARSYDEMHSMLKDKGIKVSSAIC